MERTFNSFAEALDWYLDTEMGHGANNKVAKRLVKLFDDDKKRESWAVQIGKWRSGERDIQSHNLNKINAVLNVAFNENELGGWNISHTSNKNPQDRTDRTKESLDQLLEELKSRHSVFDIPDTPRGHALKGIVDDVVSLFLKLDHLIQEEKNRSED